MRKVIHGLEGCAKVFVGSSVRPGAGTRCRFNPLLISYPPPPPICRKFPNSGLTRCEADGLGFQVTDPVEQNPSGEGDHIIYLAHYHRE